MNKFTRVLVWVAIMGVLVMLGVAMNQSAERDRVAFEALQKCIDKVAREEGYTGNSHGLEAWQLFGGTCVKQQ